MTFNEQDHPRDEMGKFTFKNGGEENTNKKNEKQNQKMTPFKLGAEINVYKNETLDETPVEILYGKSKNTEQQEQAENKYRNILLDVLGKKATPAMVLLKNSKQLEKIVKENGLWDKVKQKTIEIGIGKGYDKGGYWLAKNYFSYGPDTAGMLDMAHKKRMEPEYTKDTIKIKNFDDIQNKQDRKYLVKKLNEQFSEYIDVTNIENIEGYNFKENSEPSQRIAQDKDFQNIIKNNKEKILKGEEISGNFPRHQKSNENNWHFALGHFDIRNTEIDKKGNLHIKVYDTYDFNKENKTVANQAGYKQMHKGNLKPFFTIHDILIPKSELDRIWNEE